MSVWKDPQTGKWKYKFEHRGKRYKKEGFSRQQDALLAESKKRTMVNAPGQSQVPFDFLEETILNYLKFCEKRKMSANTIRQKYFVLTNLCLHIGDKQIDQVTKMSIENYLDTRISAGKSTYNRDLRDINAMFNWHFGRRAVLFNPANEIKKIGEDTPNRYVPPIADFNAVKLVASRDECDFIETIFHAGLRRIEAVRLLWSRDIDFESRTVISWTRKRKDGALTPKPKAMTNTLYGILQDRYRTGNREDDRVFHFETDDLDHMMSRICKRAGVPLFTLHSLRHLGASILLSENVPLTATQNYLGHERLSTTDRYTHTFSSSTQRAVEALDGIENQDRTESDREEKATVI